MLIGNDPPTIEGAITFLVTVDEENSYTFSANDSNDFNVTLEGEEFDDGVLSHDGNGTYTFTWRPVTIPNITQLSFVARDVIGATSLHSPSVLLCACFNGGECVEDVPSLDMPMLTLACECDEGTACHSIGGAIPYSQTDSHGQKIFSTAMC